MKKKITIDPMREATPTQYKNFKGVSNQVVNNWLHRDKKLLFRTMPIYRLTLIQIPENELEDYQKWLAEQK